MRDALQPGTNTDGMGSALSGVRESVTRCINTVSLAWVNTAIATLYALFAILCLVAVILLIANDLEQWPSTFAFVMVLLTSLGHFGLVIGSFVLVEDYKHYSVEPVSAFVITDGLQGMMLGVGAGSYLVDSTAKAPMYVAATLLTLAHAAMFYKVLTILRGVSNGTRDKLTGRIIEVEPDDSEYY